MDDPSAMPARLAAFLAEAEPSATAVEVHSYEVMTGGYSRLLARAEVEWTVEGERHRRTFVLRGDPPPDRSLIHTDRTVEWSVLRAVADRGVRTARPHYFDATGQQLGTPAIVLEHSEATPFLTHVAGGGSVDGLEEQLAATLASYHTIPLDALPDSLTRPGSWDDYLSARIDEWREAADHSAEEIPMLRYVAAWLDAHRPPPAPLTLMHGDLQSANLLLSEDGEFVVLDWELAAVGDPREDMGYFKAVAQAAPPDLLDGERAERFCARYRALTGLDERQVNPVTIAYFLILGVVGTVRRLLEGGRHYARGDNTLLASVFNLSSVVFGGGVWLPATRQLEPVLAMLAAAEEGA